MEINQPRIFVVSAPSGAGKTTLIKKAQKLVQNITFSVSHTSRKPRSGEKHGLDYYFVSESEFQRKIKEGDFLEWAEVYGNYYGTSKSQISGLLEKGRIVILDIDVQGAMQLRNVKEMNIKFVFIEPPSIEELNTRLNNRGTETVESINKRIQNAKQELMFKDQYDFVIINDELDRAVNEFVSIITSQ
ncbi:guanylate kinase [bacterium]|nr:guanylate kinase [bacterium]